MPVTMSVGQAEFHHLVEFFGREWRTPHGSRTRMTSSICSFWLVEFLPFLTPRVTRDLILYPNCKLHSSHSAVV